ncbi:MAG: glucosamine-6-phosphate deaminase [Kordiimonadaceae bacterium]|jgi:glucosamine-6-phosphate deaminase|nr:glucosamine-6-phosphate deaminase [Kordiimonadaceae bacterium]MBT6032559.1 glucosamine-6-phosphate deaminase [Kordiimonadaceae bacterium]
MKILTFQDKNDLGIAAAKEGAAAIKKAINENGEATIVVATGASQFEMLNQLVEEDVDWSRVTAFHMDEYVGLPITHKASFRKYLQERILDQLPAFKHLEFVCGDVDDVKGEVERLNQLLDGKHIDVCFGGIGENCHLAFNDPPADFDIKSSYHVVELDEACRQQQMGEGWFRALDDVPTKAISMTIHRIMTCDTVIICAPDDRKADAAKHAIEGPITANYPASILQRHQNTSFYLDAGSSSLLGK